MKLMLQRVSLPHPRPVPLVYSVNAAPEELRMDVTKAKDLQEAVGRWSKTGDMSLYREADERRMTVRDLLEERARLVKLGHEPAEIHPPTPIHWAEFLAARKAA